MNMCIENPGLSHIGEKIIKHLDFKTKVSCRLVGKQWQLILDRIGFKSYWPDLFLQMRNLDLNRHFRWRALVDDVLNVIHPNDTSNMLCFFMLNFVRKNVRLFNRSHEQKPIVAFARIGNYNMVQHILAMNYFDKEDWGIALVIASKKGYADLVPHLLLAGANFYTQDRDSCWDFWAALKNAASEGHCEVVKCFLNQPMYLEEKIHKPIVLAARNGHIDVLKMLMEYGKYKPWDVTNENGDNLNQIASSNGHVDIMNYFSNEYNQF